MWPALCETKWCYRPCRQSQKRRLSQKPAARPMRSPCASRYMIKIFTHATCRNLDLRVRYSKPWNKPVSKPLADGISLAWAIISWPPLMHGHSAAVLISPTLPKTIPALPKPLAFSRASSSRTVNCRHQRTALWAYGAKKLCWKPQGLW